MSYMKKHLTLVIAGMLISFVGALPLGSLNITAFDIAAHQGMGNALGFSLAAILVELCYVRLTLMGTKKLVLSERFTRIALPLAAALLIYLALSNWFSTTTATEFSNEGSLFPKINSPILLGLVLSALNPLQIPFWMLWNNYLLNKGILRHQKTAYANYMIGIGLGTLAGLVVFMYLGVFIVSNHGEYTTVTHSILGLLYFCLACYILFILFKKHLNLKTS